MVILAVCCRCGKTFIISETGAGIARDYCGLCDNCKAEVGDLDQKIEAIKRKIREHAESARSFRKEFNETTKLGDTARDNIYGPKGSAVSFFRAIIDLANSGKSLGTSTNMKNSRSLIQNLVKYANKTKKLSDDVFSYLDARREAADLQSILDKIDQGIEKSTKEKQCIECERNNQKSVEPEPVFDVQREPLV